MPDVDVQDDSSFAWVVFRQVFLDAPGGHSRALARRLVGSQFDPPVAVDGLGGFPSPDSVGPPRVDISGRGDGYAASASSVAPFGAVLKDKIFNAGVALGAGVSGAALPVAATDENGDGLVAWQSSDQTIQRAPTRQSAPAVPSRRHSRRSRSMTHLQYLVLLTIGGVEPPPAATCGRSFPKRDRARAIPPSTR